MGYEREIICKGCGAKYKLFSAKITIRDKDSEECSKCGNTLIKWNGAIMYRTEMIK